MQRLSEVGTYFDQSVKQLEGCTYLRPGAY